MILHHRITPCTSKTTRPPLIILHGFLGSSSNWTSIANELKKDTTVYCFDLRNHGASSQSDEITYDVMASDVKETCKKLSIKNPIILGHSMGGKVAIKACTLYPKEFSGLIVADISPRYYPRLLFVETIKKLVDIDLSLFANRQEIEENLSHIIEDQALLRFLLKNVKIDAEKKHLTWVIPLPMLYKKRNFLKQDVIPKKPINLPAVFLKGELSPYINEDDAKLIKEKFPKSKLITIAAARHWLHVENRTDLIKEVQKFIYFVDDSR